MKLKKISLFSFICIFFISLPLFSYSQKVLQEAANTDSLSEVNGVIVCINDEVAKLRSSKPMCDKYGHLYGLKTSDGTIWSFMVNPIGNDLRENDANLGKEMKVWGRLYYKAKIIEVTDFKILQKNQR